MINKIQGLFILGLFPFLLLAQQKEVSFVAYADAKQVTLNSYFDLNFTVKNGNGSNFKPPRFSNFKVVGGPSKSSQTSIVNGSYSSEYSYIYSLQPIKLGKFKIGSATINVNGKTYRTMPVQIEVVKTKEGGIDDSKKYYIKAEPSTTEAWVGQQIMLDYKLYTTINIDSYNVIEESDYPGFYTQEVRRHDPRLIREVIDGVQYATKVLKRVALFPQQAGALTVEPLNIQLGVVTDNSRNRGSSIFGRKTERVPVLTDKLTINVRPLPANPPLFFTGAVGNFKVNTSINRKTFTTDDAISIKMTITGNGDIKRVQAPDLSLSDDFELYDPKVLDENTYELNGVLTGKKIFEYLIVPKKTGQYQIRPEFTYFSPDSNRYITYNENIFQFAVRQGSQSGNAPIIEKEREKPQEDIRYIDLATNVQVHKNTFFGSMTFWILSLFPFLIFSGALVFKLLQNRQNALDPALLKRRRAQKVAKKRLATAENYLKTNNSKAFYDEISKGMLGYVCDKLQIPLSELTKDNVREKLTALKVEQNAIEQFMKVIQNCEIALFSGRDNAEAMNETYQNAVVVLSGIEESAV